MARGTAIMLALLLCAAPAVADSNAVEQLRDRINQLEKRLDKLARQQQSDNARKNANKSNHAIKLGQTKIDFGGYIKLDAFYDFEGKQGTTLLPTDVAVKGGPDEDPHLGWTAKETRLNIATTTPTAIGDVHGYIEWDMYGTGFDSSDEGGAPRLRLAYITYDNWLFGRAYTTFANDNYGELLNFAGPTEQVFQRTEQIRYTFHLKNGAKFAVALEDAAPTDVKVTVPDKAAPAAVADARESTSSLPQLAMRYQASMANLDWQVAGLARSVEAESNNGVEDTALGWGVNFGGTLSLAGGTSLMLSASYGEGVGDIIYTANFGPAGYFQGDELETNKRYGVIGTVSQQWTKQLTTNLIYAYSNWQTDATGKEVSGTSLTANLLYSPVEALVFGIEYDRVTKEIRLGGTRNDGAANRIQFSTIYYFAK